MSYAPLLTLSVLLVAAAPIVLLGDHREGKP